MKYKILFPLLSICFALFIATGSVMAQSTIADEVEGVGNKRIGTAAATELLIPVGGRGLAMGGAMVSTAVGVDALHWNPAGLARMAGSAEGMFSNMSYIADISVNYGAVGLAFGSFGKVGMFVKALDFGEIPFTTVDDPEGLVGRTFSPKFFTLGFSYAREFTDAITAGATIKLISEDMQRVSGSGFAIDLGVQYESVAGFRGVNLGVVLKNIGPAVSFDGPGLLRVAQAAEANRPAQFYSSEAAGFELPSSVEIALNYVRNVNDDLRFSVGGSYENNNLALDSYKGGAEVVYAMSNVELAGRAGVDARDTSTLDENIFGPGFGFGLTYKTPGMDITIDYAYRSVDFFDSNNMFSIILGF